ncbi:MAG: hypothetical protein GF311_23935 [Candidatus Lokiarchaeota archaeon]|nr:hypothetical protein [Candidatus Lokiarchaeota archaeon]
MQEPKNIFRSFLNDQNYECIQKFIEEQNLQRSFAKYIGSINSLKQGYSPCEYLTIYNIEVDLKTKSVIGIEVICMDPYGSDDPYTQVRVNFSFQIGYAFRRYMAKRNNYITLSRRKANIDENKLPDVEDMAEIDRWLFKYSESELQESILSHSDINTIDLCLGFSVRDFQIDLGDECALDYYEEEELSVLNDYAIGIFNQDWIVRYMVPKRPKLSNLE